MAASNTENAPWVRLGDYITECDERNWMLKQVQHDNHCHSEDDTCHPELVSGSLGIESVRGISIEKKLIPTKADMNGVSLAPYKVMKPKELCYVTVTSRNGGKISLAMNDTESTFILSSSYIVFRSNDENILLPEYLYLLLSRSEFDRYSRFNSWGSARETFDWSEMCRVKIPLPSIETQRKLAAVYRGLKELAEENEKLLEPLSKSCQAFIVDCKKKYPMKRLGDCIEEVDIKNSDNKIKAVKSVSVTKEFKETGAKVNKEELSGYKLVPPRHISYVQTTKNEKCFANALNTSDDTYVVTSVNKVIKSKDESILDVGYLHLFLRREEFDRYAIFNSWGSAREVFSYEDLCEVKIPLPPIEIQQKIVDLYNCYEECKRIATQAREKIKNICPALIQKAAHSK